MVQRKLDYYLQRSMQPERSPPPPPCALSFLDLPYHVRRRIYLLAGLVRFCPINLNQEGPRARHYLMKDDLVSDYACYFESRKFMGKLYEHDCRPACYCPPLPFSLLYISRALSKEVSHTLYSENSFTISKSDSWGLKPLQNLNAAALSSLRILAVRLNNCECIYKGAFQSLRTSQGPEVQSLFSCHPLCQGHGFHDQPLQSRARQHTAILQEWQYIVGELSSHCQLDSLRLDLVCDTQNMDSAQDVVNLLSPIQNLRACSIRLNQKPSWQHSTLARLTACRLGGGLPRQTEEEKPKTYYLPPEILSRILEYSELVAPFDLEWSSDRGLVPFDCCTKCTATLDFCACSFYHGAHSLTCTCWRLPLHIFLVSRQVYEISKTIFYQRNRFIILPKSGRLDDLKAGELTLPGITEWVKMLPPGTVKLLRSVGLVVPVPHSVTSPSYIRLLAKWENAVRLLLTTCESRKLSLSLFMGHKEDWGRGPEPEAILRSTYQAWSRSVQGICELQDLFIYIQWPDYTTADDTIRYSSELEKRYLAQAMTRRRGEMGPSAPAMVPWDE
ncbi:hypothetical protein PG994_004307 [Apiospora phragmitis]|uniref:F-box domain-containing protein n=1 Tax=Apiospora phragmitis TaxID=2905665 RepID=A0ABR1VQ81_9PEZI